jgi:hypothetical protein
VTLQGAQDEPQGLLVRFALPCHEGIVAALFAYVCEQALRHPGKDGCSTQAGHGVVSRSPYSLNLVRCRRALVDCQVSGDFESMESLAEAVGISRSTASRFFSGRPTSLAVTKRILDALHLKFEDVLTPEAEDNAA